MTRNKLVQWILDNKKGAIIGFLLGTVGVWLMAMLSLVWLPAELITAPFFILTRWLGQFSQNAVLLLLINGLIYSAIGTAIQGAIRRWRKR